MGQAKSLTRYGIFQRFGSMAMNIKRWKLTNAFGGACGRLLIILILTLILSICGFASRVFAHVTLEQNQAPVGTSYKAVVRVPHGCDGSATTAIRVRIPEGVLDVKPMPKPGWAVTIIKGKYVGTHSLHHAQVSEGVTEVDWSGGRLPDEYYDEFVFQSYLASDLEAGQVLYFPVVQECEKGVHKWIEVPTAGSNHPEPAPGLKLVPKP